MTTPSEYRRMAKDCLGWAGKARSDNARDAYTEFARLWVESASKLDGGTPITPERGIPPRPSHSS
jgi:hypothetical protein